MNTPAHRRMTAYNFTQAEELAPNGKLSLQPRQAQMPLLASTRHCVTHHPIVRLDVPHAGLTVRADVASARERTPGSPNGGSGVGLPNQLEITAPSSTDQ